MRDASKCVCIPHLLQFNDFQTFFESFKNNHNVKCKAKENSRAFAERNFQNLLVTVSALLRWQQRQNNISAATVIGITLDKYFDNDTMSRIYPNMKFLQLETTREI